MMTLCFERSAQIVAGRRVRPARFKPRSTLPLSAACLVANGVRETLASLLGSAVVLHVMEPVVPDANAWYAIADGAGLYAVRGPVADAVFVLRPADASALAAAAFGERCGEPRALSAVERHVLERLVRALSGCAAPLCGREPSPPERILDISTCAAYFELVVDAPVTARLGVAVSRDPAVSGGATLRIDDLLDVEVELAAQFAAGQLAAGAFLELREGTFVPMMTRVGEPGVLHAGGTVLARGECGTLGQRSALAVSAS